jgi:hypothetical protein
MEVIAGDAKRVYNYNRQSSHSDSYLRLFSASFDFDFKKYLFESDDFMAISDITHLRYIGVLPQTECLEYGFRIEDKDKEPRLVVMMIESGFFKEYALMFQEAPDLCYQKLLADLKNETAETPVSARSSVTASDITHYRELHPVGKSSKLRSRNKPQ